MLQINNVTKTYLKNGSRVDAVKGITLRVEKGEFVAVRGHSGCGKTTLLLMAGCLLAPTSGTVLIDGRDPYDMSPDQRARLRASRLGFVFQQFHLIPYLTVRENVMASALANGAAANGARVNEMLERFHLTHRAAHRPAELSTGERQRTALARALMNEPGLLLADEPTGNLDFVNAGNVLDHLKEFARSGGAVLLVTHSAEALSHADRVLELSAGQWVETAGKILAL